MKTELGHRSEWQNLKASESQVWGLDSETVWPAFHKPEDPAEKWLLMRVGGKVWRGSRISAPSASLDERGWVHPHLTESSWPRVSGTWSFSLPGEGLACLGIATLSVNTGSICTAVSIFRMSPPHLTLQSQLCVSCSGIKVRRPVKSKSGW